MDKHKRSTWEICDQAGGVGHLGREHLELEKPVQLGQQPDIGPEDGVVHGGRARGEAEPLVLVPVQLQAGAAQKRRNGDLLAEHFARPGVEKVGRPHDGLGPPGGVVGTLGPADLVHDPVERPVGLDVNGGADALGGGVPDVLVDEIVAPHRLVRPEDARHHRPFEPWQIRHAPYVMVTVDDVLHAEVSRAERLCRRHSFPPSP